MASTTIPIQIIDDDDDEFDWEAAVQEIDVACQASKPFTWAPDVHSHQVTDVPTCLPIPDKRPGTSRQSTLDRFMGIPNSMPEIKKAHRDQDKANVEFDEMPSCVKIDAEAAKTWIYPVNIPLRDYQFSITRTALFSNTLVALPTGLGKTLIAAVVMYNYFRWFPEGGMILTPVLGDSMSGKIVFAAPSRPLVMQQIEACHNIVGIPQEWTIDMTGQVSPTRRSCFWKAKRVFFVTPQVLEKDIQSGSCLVKHLVCLVIDEAHRASGNYSYCVALRELMAVPVQLRILALSATPGSKQQAIQQIIDNLQISTLEYRNESDHDVIPYVHDRKIELIQVALGPDAVEINNLLLQVIRPFVARLCAVGVLQKRDFQTLSPCELLNSRDKFRQAPPEDLPHMKYGEVEGYFGVLITLYHIRKLLSSHGIRPACEMLEEKLKQGSFARLMSRNEVLGNARVLMQQSLSHGAPSPKLSKLLEVLIDHFKKKDPQNSRVIIFSNFRGSVRDIMDALTNIPEYVKATEFIGQSSGKISKGQSQKVQQAVLEKFRAGGYNVIVATSIGEEGLDIMEVDLVICFDANISPLRMIQRMGRTGRKHEGRVDILLASLNLFRSELKGYIRKQANSSAIKKHMRNGGMNSFNFHSSPRMIPHIFKPEVQFVELSIEQFVPRGKRVKDDQNIETPLYKDKLTDAEADLVMKYFPNMKENTWRPSLIAFPHFQAFPSRVHEVVHSFRTGMLIDTMQCLQGLSFSGDSKAFVFEDEAISDMCLRVETVEEHYSNVEGSSSSILQNCFKSETCQFRASLGEYRETTVQVKGVSATRTSCKEDNLIAVTLCNSDDLQKETPAEVNGILQTPVSKKNISNAEDNADSPKVMEKQTPVVPADDSSNDFKEVELSPRLTNFYECGIVPESPVHETGEKQKVKDSRVFIEEEAEVSSEVSVSDDEDDEQDDSYDGSFIDDRINTPAASTQAEASRSEMMAIYRNSEPFELQSKVVSSEALPCTTDATQIGKESKIESRKRKLSFNQTGSVPVQNLDQEFLLQTEAACRDASLQVQGEASGYVFDDDWFYEGIDLDAMEEQAAKLLSNKSEMSMQKEVIIPEPVPELVGSPTFDLGI
ncbi:hypothetical protein RJ640_003377 [Escallonia rubra]|uniref:Uncharacterized protein n=1 Tax=Escallonia rubra TaxID=112253 RepID=A0AA88U375_9ASTE|nr:hypothetical protein RJ640_003377 [Escallonia rubra]